MVNSSKVEGVLARACGPVEKTLQTEGVANVTVQQSMQGERVSRYGEPSLGASGDTDIFRRVAHAQVEHADASSQSVFVKTGLVSDGLDEDKSVNASHACTEKELSFFDGVAVTWSDQEAAGLLLNFLNAHCIVEPDAVVEDQTLQIDVADGAVKAQDTEPENGVAKLQSHETKDGGQPASAEVDVLQEYSASEVLSVDAGSISRKMEHGLSILASREEDNLANANACGAKDQLFIQGDVKVLSEPEQRDVDLLLNFLNSLHVAESDAAAQDELLETGGDVTEVDMQDMEQGHGTGELHTLADVDGILPSRANDITSATTGPEPSEDEYGSPEVPSDEMDGLPRMSTSVAPSYSVVDKEAQIALDECAAELLINFLKVHNDITQT